MARECQMSLSDRALGMVASLSGFENWRIQYALTEHPGGWDYWLGPLRKQEVTSDRLRKTLMAFDLIERRDEHRVGPEAKAEENSAYAASS